MGQKEKREMETKTKEILIESVTNVFEKFAFMFTDTESDADTNKSAETFMHASITFNGKSRGVITVTATKSLCVELATNVLGEDIDEETSSAPEDALKEVLNIVCGAVVVELYGEKEVFDLTVPTIYKISWEKWEELAAEPGIIKLYIDDEPILISLIKEEQII